MSDVTPGKATYQKKAICVKRLAIYNNNNNNTKKTIKRKISVEQKKQHKNETKINNTSQSVQ